MAKRKKQKKEGITPKDIETQMNKGCCTQGTQGAMTTQAILEQVQIRQRLAVNVCKPSPSKIKVQSMRSFRSRNFMHLRDLTVRAKRTCILFLPKKTLWPVPEIMLPKNNTIRAQTLNNLSQMQSCNMPLVILEIMVHREDPSLKVA